jgi:C_GCAxxG_C_C family probable redox protein
MNMIRSFENTDWAATWRIIAPVFRAGESYPFSPDITEEDAYEVWIEIPSVTYVAVDNDNEILGTYYIKPNQPALGAHVCNCGYIVSENARGEGIGSEMCEHSQREAIANLATDQSEKLSPEAEDLIRKIKERARSLYLTRQLLCTESIMVALNQGLDGGLSEAQALATAAPFSVALGKSGCMCGALSGAAMASGLFLGNHHPHRHRREMRDSARELYEAFKAENGATCCSVLSRKVKQDKSAHSLHCANLTAEAAESAARLILKKSPVWQRVPTKDSWPTGNF